MAISYFFVDPAISRQDASQTPDTLFALKPRILRQASVEILLDLVDGQGLTTRELGESVGKQLGLLQSDIQ